MQTKIIGHRGFKSKYPENTLLSFEQALIAGVDGIELDVHYTKDGKIVVFHDFTLERMTNISGNIFDFTYAELSEFLVTFNAYEERIPLLSEVVDLVAYYDDLHSTQPHHRKKEPLLLNVEFKAGSQFYPDIEEKTVDLCLNKLTKNQVIFSSFDHFALQKIKQIDPTLKTGALTTAALVDPWHYLKSIKADYYHPHYLSLTAKYIKDLMTHQVLINTYTVNDPATADVLIKSGINSIITDVPDILLSLRLEDL